MMTSKQKWFINKLASEIEAAGHEINWNATFYGSVMFDSYRVSKKEASEDIGYLLELKDEYGIA